MLKMSKIYNCEECDFTSKHKKNYKRHMEYKHCIVIKEQTKCEICSLQFATGRHYVSHRKKIHPTEEETKHKKDLRAARNHRHYIFKKHGV